MKTIIKRTSVTMLMIALVSMGALAQNQRPRAMNGNGSGFYGNNADQCRLEMTIPNLTDEQAAELKDLRLEQLETTQTYRNLTGEIRAKQQTLRSTYPIDQKALNNLIDNKTALMNKHLKANINHQAAVKEVLTEEQQVYMNQMMQRRGQFAQGNGMGRYQGNFNQGRGGMNNGMGRYQGNFNQGRGGMNKGMGRYQGNFNQGRGQRW